jgi:tetratricopeptide (TPR) repeat protein
MRAPVAIAAALAMLLAFGAPVARAEDVNATFKEAIQLQKQGDYEGAMTRLTRILPLISAPADRAKVQILTGIVLVQQRKWDEALQSLESGLATVEDREWKARGLWSVGIAQYAKRNREEAASALEQAVPLLSDGAAKAGAGNQLGMALLDGCRLDDAREALTDALRAATTSDQRSAILLNLGVVSDREWRLDEAADRYREAADAATQADDKALALSNLAIVHHRQNRAQASLTTAQSAAAIARSDELRLIALQGVADALWDQGRIREAQEEFEKIVAQSGSLEPAANEFDARASNLIGRAALLQNIQRDRTESQRLLEEALSIAKRPEERSRAYQSIAPIYARNGRLDDALAAYADGERIGCDRQGKAVAAEGQGAILRRLGRLPEAAAKLEAGLQLAATPSLRTVTLIQLFNLHVRERWGYILIVLAALAGAGIAGSVHLRRRYGISLDAFAALRRPTRQLLGGAAGALVGALPTVVYDYFFVNMTSDVDYGFSQSLLHDFAFATMTPDFLINRALNWFFVAALIAGVISTESWGAADLRRRLLRGAGWAVLAGGVGGILLDWVLWLLLRDSFSQLSIAILIAITGLCLGLWGALIGLGAGLTYGSRARAWRGALGGLVGGLLAGVLFYPTYAVLLDVLPYDDPICITCVLRWVMLGATIGFALGMVDLGFKWPLRPARAVAHGAPRAAVAPPPQPQRDRQSPAVVKPPVSSPQAASPVAGGDWWSTGSIPPAGPVPPQRQDRPKDPPPAAKPETWWTDDKTS